MKRFYKDERGSSLVLTIIAMAFISLLAVAVISMTVTNIRLKISQKGSQKNFYTTDSVMDEIRAGVEDMASKASVEAYMDAFKYYASSASGNPDSMSDKYNKMFLTTMIEYLSDSKSAYGDATLYYQDDVLQAYLIQNGENPDRYVKHSMTLPSSTKTYGNLVMENDTLLLKDVQVTMTEHNKSYKTTLTSDIRVNIPEMMSSTRSEYLNYALIADNQVIANVGGTATVEGNVYAGTVRRYAVAGAVDETGILVGNGTTFDVKAEQLVTRGDLFVHGGSTFKLDELNGNTANLWAENIFTSSKDGGGNTIEISAWSHVSDDMEIDGKDDSVTLKGRYWGYNYNYGYSSTNAKNLTEDSEYSSAILVNGQNTNLNMSGLKSLVLSGRTFISKKATGEIDERGATSAPASTAKPVVNADIAMGESLSVKGSQIAYYVPNDFVTAKELVTPAAAEYSNKDESARTITYVTSADLGVEYTFDYGSYLKYLYNLDYKTATDAELDAKLPAGFNFTDFLATYPLVTYYRNDKTVQVDSVTYYYLNFINDTKMLEYYDWFKGQSPRYSTVEDINASYLGSTGISINNGGALIRHTGNILYRNGASGNMQIKLHNESVDVDSSVLHRYAMENCQKYMSMQLALVENYTAAKNAIKADQYRLIDSKTANLSKSGEADNTNLYDVLIDSSKMPASLVEEKNDTGTGVVVIQPDDSVTYTWDGSASSLGGLRKGIIIAAGDVEVKQNFSGLILAGGDIKMAAAGIKVTSNCELLEKMFTEDKAKATPMFFNLFSKYFRKVLTAAIGREEDASSDVVIYEKWKKE